MHQSSPIGHRGTSASQSSVVLGKGWLIIGLALISWLTVIGAGYGLWWLVA